MMDRGREGRRSSADRGPVSAPRRPRTSGFKDASVGEDCDDTMDDVHSARLRERPKKDSSSLMSGKGFVSSGVVSISRIKRKRQGLHEIQVQVRGSIADEVEDTTHDSEIGASEDDDDLPPPPIPRRLAKSRAQGKGVEDISIRNDLPAVPRKARSAVPKRVQESPPPPVLETPSHPPQLVASPTPAPSSTLSSSSVVTLKPRRRTKPSGSKPKISKLLKVSTPTVSEEVEVAEALFDLARTIPPPALDQRMDLKPESKAEVKSLASGSAQTLSPAAQLSYAAVAPSLIPAINSTTGVILGPSPAAASPVPSPSSPSAAAPAPAEAPKRKRPRFRTHPDEGAPQPAGLVNGASCVIPIFPGAAGLQSREVNQTEAHPTIADEGLVKTESVTTAPMSAAGPASSSPCGAPVLLVPGPSMRQNNMVEKKHDKLEKKIFKGEVTRTTSNEKNSSSVPPLDKKPAPVKLAGPTMGIQGVDTTMTSSPLPSDSPTKMEVAKRSAQSTPSSEAGGLNKFDIDLMALPSKAALPSINEKNGDVPGVPVEEGQEKPPVKVSVMSPVASGWIEKEREERQEQDHQETDETERELPKEQEGEKDRERIDLSKLPLQWASKGVKPESRPQKSEKASPAVGASVTSSLLASTATSPISPGMPGWPGVIPSLGYFPAAAAAAVAAAWPAASSTGHPSVDENLQPRLFTFSNMPPQQPWKRCACHVWIAHFIDTQQQVNQHPFFAAGLYGGKSYNPNMSLPPPEALYGRGGVAQLAAIAGPPASSAVALGTGLGVGEQVLGATTITGAKERERERKAAANFMEPANQDTGPQQQQPSLSLQVGVAFGFSGIQAGTVAIASDVSSAGVGNGVAAAAANMGTPALPGSSSGPGTSSIMAGSLGPTGGPGTMASNRVAVSAASVQEQYLHAMMQNLGFPYHQYPGPHFGPRTFSGPPAHLGTQQAAVQYFASAPFFGQHLVSPAQNPVHQTSVVASGGPVPLQKQQQQQGVRRFPPTGSLQQPPPQSPSHSSSQQQQQPKSDRDGQDMPSGGDNVSVAESKFPILHRPPYSQGSPHTSVTDVSVPPASVQALPSQQDFSILASLGKQSKQREQQQQPQLQASQSQPSLSSQLQQQQQQAQLQINLKGIDPQATQALSAMTMAAAMNRGPIGPGPLGLAPVAAVMAPQGHAMLQSMADAARQSPDHSSGASAPHASIIQQQQQQQQHMHQLQFQQQNRQQQQHQPQHRSVQMQRGLLGVDEGHMVADASNYPSNTGAGLNRDLGEDRKTSSKRPIGSSSSMSRVELDSSPTRGTARNVAPTLNLTASTSATMSSHPSGHIAQGAAPPLIAQPSQAPRQSMVCTKGITGPNTASSSASNQSNMVSLASASLTAKVSGPELSLPGQTPTPASQVARQTSIAQHPQLKLSQRTSMGSMATAPGTDPKAVLAAAMAKVQNPQSQLQQSRLPQVTPHTGSLSRMSSAVSGTLVSSSPIPLSPFPAGSKSSTSVGAKQASSGKGSPSLPTTQKSGGSASGKRNSLPSLSQHVILGSSPSLGNQSVSAKLPQQQQEQLVAQNSHPLVQQPQVPQQYALSLQQQYPQPSQLHKQQNSQQQQIQMQQQQQQQQMEMLQQQQLSHSQLQPPPPQHVQQYQQQLQQSPVHHLNQQQQQSPSLLSGSITNGGLSLTPAAMSGLSNSGNIVNSGQSSGSENIGGSQATNSRPAPFSLSVSPLSGSGSQRGSSSGSSFLHCQFSSSQGMTSNVPVMQSIQLNSIAPYPQSAAAVGAGGKQSEVKTSTEPNSQEQLNSIRPMQAPASVRTPMSSAAAGPSSIPQPSPV